MLELKKVKKVYETDGFKQTALNDVSLNFRDSEFVSILGPSGSGKTTLLNIIGGLDRYDSGDLIINNISTKKYKDKDWDSYRNHTIGFVFQSYNLIPHQTILSNVELALTISGVSKKKRKELALEALEKVGLLEHAKKRPSQLSGGQMQRVAIARALVNNPDILLADEPTGALDTKTSLQVMELLKEVTKDRLVVMVTHNPELAKKYSTRIVKLQDGKIVGDSKPYNPKKPKIKPFHKNMGKSSMGFLTALQLSLNNLLTKKGRTILTSFAGSIGIIGIALILSVATGFQNYIDKIQEDALSSYPLTIEDETANTASLLLSMTKDEKEKTEETDYITEKKNIAQMFESVGKNDLKSFKQYLSKNQEKVDELTSSISYTYNINPTIYTLNIKNKIYKSNPSETFNTLMGGSSSYMNMSVFGMLPDDDKIKDNAYEIIKGRYPKNYDELILVLPDENHISDLLLYTLGLKDDKKLDEMIDKLMNGEKVKDETKELKFTYDELMNIDLRLIMPFDLYKYNKKYDLYENMEDNEKYMKNLYNKALKLKIVGIVKLKDSGRMGSIMSGVGYTFDLVKYIIKESSSTDIVLKQLSNKKINVFNGKKFSDKSDDSGLDFDNLIEVDEEKLKNAFGGSLNEKDFEKIIKKYMKEIANEMNPEPETAAEDYLSKLSFLLKKSLKKYIDTYGEDKPLSDEKIVSLPLDDVSKFIKDYLKTDSVTDELKEISNEYGLPIKNVRQMYQETIIAILDSLEPNPLMPALSKSSVNMLVNMMVSSNEMKEASLEVGNILANVKMQKDVATSVGNLTEAIIKKITSSFKVDADEIASAFKFNLDEDELKRIFKTMTTSNKKSDYKTNLSSLGYQDLEEPTTISFYFKDFESKEKFIDFLEEYNEEMKKFNDDKVIEYTDITGILISSVKVIVDSVSYVLIAFVSISLIVSSIMIGIITYISVLERTKEIGILRAIGASKRNISSIFNAETFIVGLLSGLLGIGVSLLLLIPINSIIHTLTSNNDITAVLPINGAIILIMLSVLLTLIGGIIPSKGASKKDPVEALRIE